MPNIRGYEAPNNLGLQPTEIGVDATAAAARRIGGFYNQKADALNQTGREASSDIQAAGDVVVKYEDHQQIIAGAAHGAELFDSLTQSKDQAIKNIDPNDPAYGQKVEVAMKEWRENTLAPALDKFSEGFSTENSQAWAQHFVDATRNHMFVSSSADISTAAGIGIRNAVRTVGNVASNTALQDPSSVQTQLDLVEHSIGGMVESSPIKGTAGAAIKSEVLEKTREQIVKAGAIGAIQKSSDPEKTAADWTAKYPQYINGAEATTLAGNARQQIRARNYDFETNRRRDKEIAQDKSNEATNQYIIDVRSQDPKLANDPTAKKILNDPTLLKTDKNALLNFIDRQHNPEKVVDDPIVTSDLMTRMFSADKPTTTLDLMKARAEGKISDHTFEAYHGLVQELEQTPLKGPVWHDTIEGVKAELVLSNVGLPGKDITGEGNYAKWAQTFIPQYLAKSRAGTLPPNALDVKDPTSMISQSMAPFKRSVQQRAQDYLSVLSGEPGSTAATRKVGDVPVPAALGGIAALQYNPRTKQWRDQTSGIVYDSAGQPAVAR